MENVLVHCLIEQLYLCDDNNVFMFLKHVSFKSCSKVVLWLNWFTEFCNRFYSEDKTQ